jgi:hypothetical protein
MREIGRNPYWADASTLSEAEDIEFGLAEALGLPREELTPEQVDPWLERTVSKLTPAESESVGDALVKLGRWAKQQTALRQFAGQVLPTAGMAVGTVYGGPAGAAFGGQLGGLAGQTIAGRKPPSPPPAPSPTAAPPAPSQQPPAPASGGADAGGSQAAGQILYLIQNDAFLKSLLRLATDLRGQTSVPIGEKGTAVPPVALVNLLGQLAGRAAEEADAYFSQSSESEETPPSYLLDSEGNYLCDPAAPAERADVLLRLLQQEGHRLGIGEDVGEQESGDDGENWEDILGEDVDFDWGQNR